MFNDIVKKKTLHIFNIFNHGRTRTNILADVSKQVKNNTKKNIQLF
jgi:hypothetical protein